MPIIKSQKSAAPHVIIDARAGCGKTTTLINGLLVLNGKKPKIKPSTQQKEIFDQIKLSKGAQSVCFVAFNKSIADELGRRIPKGCGEAMTMHRLGNRAVTSAYGKIQLDGDKAMKLVATVEGRDLRDLRRNHWEFLVMASKLVGLCKMNLVEGTEQEIRDIADHHGIEMNGSTQRLINVVPAVIEASMDPIETGTMDFNDMIWLPMVNKLYVPKHDLLMIDEAQDLNRCQHALAKAAGKRLIFCGDPKQAIYGFTGADSESMGRLYKELSATEEGCVRLPLTVTRRCGKAIVKEANKMVKDFEAHEDNSEGLVEDMGWSDYLKAVADGDMIVCRVNAPLVQQCFRLLRDGRKAKIQGRDIGKNIISTIKKTKAETISELITKIGEWREQEIQKEQLKPLPSEIRIQMIDDKHDCIVMFTEHQKTLEGVIQYIEEIFTDQSTHGITLSSVHKAKGLEAERVFILQPNGPAAMPSGFARKDWEREQERNIFYVAITRAIDHLVYVYQEAEEENPMHNPKW